MKTSNKDLNKNLNKSTNIAFLMIGFASLVGGLIGFYKTGTTQGSILGMCVAETLLFLGIPVLIGGLMIAEEIIETTKIKKIKR